MTDVEPNTPDGWELADDDQKPGEVLYPGKHTIVNKNQDALQQGETIAVWVEMFQEGYGVFPARADLQVIGDDGEGDIFAIQDDESPLEASRVYRVGGDLEMLETGYVYSVPEYDQDEGVLTVTREVKVRRDRSPILEARSLGGKQDWGLSPNDSL